MGHTETNCREENGITVGLIDGIIAIGRVLKNRDLTDKEVQEALLDLRSDEDLKTIFQPTINDAFLSKFTTEDIASMLDYLIAPSYRTEKM